MYTHDFTMLFSVESNSEDSKDVNAQEVIEGLERRIEDIKNDANYVHDMVTCVQENTES